MSEPLVPLVRQCLCGAPAIYALVVTLCASVQATIHLCGEHRSPRFGLRVLPTHEDIPTSVGAWPPKQGELCLKPLCVSCPQCSGLAMLDAKVFSIQSKGLTPSFVCPQCGLHAWLRTEASPC